MSVFQNSLPCYDMFPTRFQLGASRFISEWMWSSNIILLKSLRKSGLLFGCCRSNAEQHCSTWSVSFVNMIWMQDLSSFYTVSWKSCLVMTECKRKRQLSDCRTNMFLWWSFKSTTGFFLSVFFIFFQVYSQLYSLLTVNHDLTESEWDVWGDRSAQVRNSIIIHL